MHVGSIARLLAVGALALSVATLPASAQTPAPESHRWGVLNGHKVTGPAPVDGQLAPNDVLVRTRAAGFGWARYLLFWHEANPSQGVYYWGQADSEIARLRAAGLNVLVQIAYPPAWTTGNSYPNHAAAVWCLVDNVNESTGKDVPECKEGEYRPGAREWARIRDQSGAIVGTRYDLDPGYDRSLDFRTFLTAAVQRYGSQVQAWGSGLEVHSKIFWRGTTGELAEEMLRPTYEIVKQLAPGALVVGPDEDQEDSLEGALRLEAEGIAAGRSRLFDVIAFHTHTHSGFGEPSRLETGLLNSDGSPRLILPAGKSCEPAPTDRPVATAEACSVVNVLARHRRGRPFWLTEMGFRVAYVDQLATELARGWTTRWIRGIKDRPWIDKAFLINVWHDLPTEPGSFGLFNVDADATPVPVHPTIVGELGALPPPAFSYLAEGATSAFWDLDIAVANPHAASAPVKVSFLEPDGSVELVFDVLPPMSRRTYRVKQLPGLPSLANTAVSTVVESTLGLPLVTERTMFWDSTYYGGHGGTAVSAPAKTWYFAEGYQAPGFFDTYLLLANSGNQRANVTVTFLREGDTPVTLPVGVGPTSRENVWAGSLGDELRNRSFAMRVESDQPIIAERAMYFGPGWTGGHESAGVTAPAKEWFLAEGSTGKLFSEYVLVGNPGSDDANVTFTFLLVTGETVVGTKIVPGNSRFTLLVEETAGMPDAVPPRPPLLDDIVGNADVLRDAAVSVKVTADVPIVVERAMYWPKENWAEAHNSFGLTETSTRWGLAEGRIGRGRGFDTYILLANAGSEDAQVTITYLRSNGLPPIVQQLQVPATSRRNAVPQWDQALIGPNGKSVLADEEFGALIESSVPIVVERAMYWNGPGAPFWAGGTNATATKLP